MSPELASNWVALQTIVRREVRRFMRIWAQTLLPPAITMALYFVIFGRLIGSQVGGVGQYSYMEFIVPGLIMMSVITNSYSNVVSSFFSSKFQRNVEELLVSPVSPHTILIGYTIGGARLRLEGEGAKQESALSNQIAKQVRMELEEVLQLLRR